MGQKKQRTKEQRIEDEENYVEFLRKRLDSENYKKAVSKEEYEKERRKYDKAKLVLRLLKGECD